MAVGAEVELLVWLAVATASISFTITKTQTFDFIRYRVPDGIFYELINCPYCMSHYVAMFFVAIYHPMPLTGHWIDLLASVFIIVTLSTFMVQAILLVARVLNVLKPYDPSQKSD